MPTHWLGWAMFIIGVAVMVYVTTFIAVFVVHMLVLPLWRWLGGGGDP